LPSFWGVAAALLDDADAAGLWRDAGDVSEAATAFRTSVMEVFAEPWPDFRLEWCMERCCDWSASG